MREKEKCYLKCTASNRAKSNLHKVFKSSRYSIDNNPRQKERIYNRNKIAEIDHFKGNNPTECWKLVNNLDPKKIKKILCKVRKGDTFVTEPSSVLDVWANGFSSLYNNSSEINGAKTYVSFTDLKKTFDRKNRNFLLYKLIMNGVDGKLYFAKKSLYCQASSCVKLSNILSSSFNTILGVR